ncbi:MAG: hypothetical protein ACYDGR_05330 [Candidatus Dormibacteria bacterium]
MAITEIHLDPYPVYAGAPTGADRLPAFLDDDETVTARLDPTGAVSRLTDAIKLKLVGNGDYSFHLPNPVTSAVDQGGDVPPALDAGSVEFMGFATGAGHLDALTTLDPAAYRARLPFQLTITYTLDGRPVSPEAAAGKAGRVAIAIDFENTTGQPRTFLSGQPDPVTLGAALDALYRVPDVFTPETNLQTIFPLPSTIRLRGATSAVQRQVYAPLHLTTRVNIPAGTAEIGAAGAELATDSRGSSARWQAHVPENSTADGHLRLSISYTTAHFRVPSMDFLVDVIPLPPADFAGPTGESWKGHLGGADLPALALLAQAGAASIHRIADVAPLVNRPGPGPQKVRFEVVLDSGVAPVRAPVIEASPHASIPAIGLLALAAFLLGANAWWAWSRH